MKKWFFAISAILGLFTCCAADTEVKASSFGFDKTNATVFLQKAIDSGARKVIVDNTGSPWIIDPIKLRSDLELVFAPGVRVAALKGSYRSKGACMFFGSNVDNVTLRSEGGAVLEMHKTDYQNQPDYTFSEHRHCISFRGAHNIVIRDLTIRSSGGDGIYISSSSRRGPCRNVLIENVVSDNHHRQGISIISAVDLAIRNCKFTNTSGTAPQCGIDLEPNNSKDMLVNNVIENCDFYGNAASGALVFLPYLATPVSIVFRNCKMYNNNFGIRTTASGAKGKIQQGSILFENCCIYDNRGTAVMIAGQQKGGMTVTFRDCTFDNRKSSTPAIEFNNARAAANLTGITFENCTLQVGKQPVFDVIQRTGFGIGEIKGDIKTVQDDGSISAVDWNALRQKYPENKELQKFDFAEINYEKLRPLNDDASNAQPKSWRIRRSGTFLIYTGIKPGSYDINFDVIPIHPGRAVHYQVAVKLANNTLVEKFIIAKPKYVHTLKSNGKQLYILEITRAGETVNVSASAPAFGLLVQNRVAFFRGGMKKMYFHVQPGVEQFKIELLGTGNGEWVKARLFDHAGRLVDSCEKNSGGVILLGKRTDASKGEIWNLQLFGKEDHALRFGAPLIPVVSPDKNMVFTYGE